ncbi:MAG: hypothetical protein U0797_26585 [Gemmataceae bacterium]
MARAFTRLADREPPLWLRAMLVAAEQAGVRRRPEAAVGTFAGWQYPAEWRVLRPAAVTMAALVAAAVGFGLLAGWATSGAGGFSPRLATRLRRFSATPA